MTQIIQPLADIGIIGGSGLYRMEGLEILEERTIHTPFGAPSDAILIGKLAGKRVAFLARHRRNHTLLPSEINYRANLFALKSLGVRHLLSVSAVGSLKETLAPRHFVTPDQFIDRTRHRADTFFGDGIVAHVAFGEPICPYLRTLLFEAARDCGVTAHDSGCYVCMEGPQFSTKAESHLYRSWGADVIGMTNLTEAKLAREAQLPYATLAMVTDYDCWHEEEASVTVEGVLEVMKDNSGNAMATLKRAIERLEIDRISPIHHALTHAILTRKEAVSEERWQTLAPLMVSPNSPRGGNS